MMVLSFSRPASEAIFSRLLRESLFFPNPLGQMWVDGVPECVQARNKFSIHHGKTSPNRDMSLRIPIVKDMYFSVGLYGVWY